MSLDTVAEDIREEARARAEIRAEAEDRADDVVADAEAEAETIRSERSAEVEREVEQEREQSLSSAKLEAKQSRLEARRDLLEEVREDVEAAVAGLEGDERETLTRELLDDAADEFDGGSVQVSGRADDQEFPGVDPRRLRRLRVRRRVRLPRRRRRRERRLSDPREQHLRFGARRRVGGQPPERQRATVRRAMSTGVDDRRGPGNYEYVTARVRSRRASLFDDDDYRKLVRMGTGEIARFMEDTEYSEEMNALGSRYSGVDLIEYALNRNLAKHFEDLLRWADGRLYDFIARYLRKFDVWNVKTVIRGIYSGATAEEISDDLIRAGEIPGDLLDRIVQADTIEAVVELLSPTVFGDPLEAAYADYEETDVLVPSRTPSTAHSTSRC